MSQKKDNGMNIPTAAAVVPNAPISGVRTPRGRP